jgi:hypothetical protein
VAIPSRSGGGLLLRVHTVAVLRRCWLFLFAYASLFVCRLGGVIVRLLKLSPVVAPAMVCGRKMWELSCRLCRVPPVCRGDYVLLCPTGGASWPVHGLAVVSHCVSFALRECESGLAPFQVCLTGAERACVTGLLAKWRAAAHPVGRVHLTLFSVVHDVRAASVLLSRSVVHPYLPRPDSCSHMPALSAPSAVLSRFLCGLGVVVL